MKTAALPRWPILLVMIVSEIMDLAALTIQACILIAFMGVTFFFPTAAKLEVSHA